MTFSECPNFTGYLLGLYDDRAILLRTRCKQWSCEVCAEVNRAQWRAVIIDAVNKIGGQWAFMTLTAHQNATTEETSLKNLQGGWKRLIERIKRQLEPGFKLHFVRVYEHHEDGRIHMHALINWIPKDYKEPKRKSSPGSRWLKDNAPQCGMGNQVKIIVIKGHAGLVAAYITKYMTKQMDAFPKGTRRIQTSQGFKQPNDFQDTNYLWKRIATLTKFEAELNWKYGYTITDVNLDRKVTMLDFPGECYKPHMTIKRSVVKTVVNRLLTVSLKKTTLKGKSQLSRSKS